MEVKVVDIDVVVPGAREQIERYAGCTMLVADPNEGVFGLLNLLDTDTGWEWVAIENCRKIGTTEKKEATLTPIDGGKKR